MRHLLARGVGSVGPSPIVAMGARFFAASSSSASSSSAQPQLQPQQPQQQQRQQLLIPSSGKLRSVYDLMFGGHFKKELGLGPLFQTLYSRHGQPPVFETYLGDDTRRTYVFADPDLWMELLRAEWSEPVGTAATVWPLQEIYRDWGYSVDHPDPGLRTPFALLRGDPWRGPRFMYQKELFRQSAVDAYVPRLDEVARDAVDYVDKETQGGKTTPDLNELSSRIVFEMVASAIVGQRLGLLTNSETDETKRLVKHATGAFRHLGTLLRQPKDKGKKMPEYELMKKEWAQMLEAGKVLVGKSAAEGVDSVINRVKGKAPTDMTETRLASDLASLLGAGVDTTQATLQQNLWCLSRFPHAQAKLRDEIFRVVGRDRTTPVTADQISEMQYLRAFVREQFRCHPSGTGIFRSVEDKDVWLSSGQVIPKGSLVFYYFELNHVDPRLVNGDPRVFLPERWLNKAGTFDRNTSGGANREERDNGEAGDAGAENVSPTEGERLCTVPDYVDLNEVGARPRSVDVFAPSRKLKHVVQANVFGIGPRQCLGGRLATTEVNLAMIELVRNYRLVATNPNTTEKEVLLRAPFPDPDIRFERL